mmetsp:Transcript_556/g.603  ORF Transcript_556/g.603 Transcript_556/m.603 type:complete len:133 (+) Transcript_556:323-721(+)
MDPEIITACNDLIRKFALSLTIFTKFEDLWSKLGIQDRTLNTDCSEKIKKICWLVFIIGKVRILQRRGDIVEFVYLLAATVYIVNIYLPKQVSSNLINDFLKEAVPEEKAHIYEGLQSSLMKFLQDYIKAPH